MRTDAVSELIGFVFGTGKIAADGMAAEAGDLAAQAWLALLTNASAPAVPVETLPAHATQPGQQSVHIEICAEDRALELVVQPAEAQGVTVVKSGDAPLGRLDRALAGQALRLQVILGEAEVDLGTLQDLAVGDILRLHCRLDQPAEVLLLGQKLGCTAYPGTLDGRAAVEIGR
jgi:flagellar motor switch/type III secretory pathway protein FliN